jgi:hypothetical protein
MKICVVVLTYKSDLYDHFDRIKRKYLETKDVDYFFLYNGTDKSLSNPKEHNLNYYSDFQHYENPTVPVMWDKFMAFISETAGKYDYIIRVNSSTFVNVDSVIEKIIQHSDKEDLYMGHFNGGLCRQCRSNSVDVDGKEGEFASGACIVFSNATLEKLLEVNKIFKHNPEARMREDDVLIGLAVREVLKIPLTYLDWYYFGDQTTVPPEKIVEEALTYPQIRIRNNANRDLIDKSIWNIIERKLQL